MNIELPPLEAYASEPALNGYEPTYGHAPLPRQEMQQALKDSFRSEQLQDSEWLAERLSISVSAVHKARIYQPDTIPPHIKIGRAVRYCPKVVDAWLTDNMKGED